MSKSTSVTVSVVIPFFNAVGSLANCMKSLEKQTLNSNQIELIFVDDFSDDNGNLLLRDLLKKSKFKSRILKHSKNKGPGAARNTGITIATGDYLFFLDSDDMIHKTAIEKLLRAAMQNDADFTFADTFWRAGRSNRRKGSYSYEKTGVIPSARIAQSIDKRIRNPVRKNDILGCKAKLIKRSFLTGAKCSFEESMRYLEDELFIWDVLGHAKKISYVRAQLYYYQESTTPSGVSTSLTHSFPSSHIETIYFKVLQNYRNRGVKLEKSEAAARQAAGYFIINILISLSKSIILGKVDYELGRKRLLSLIRDISENELTSFALRSYTPSKEDSRLLIFSLKFRLKNLAVRACLWRASKLLHN